LGFGQVLIAAGPPPADDLPVLVAGARPEAVPEVCFTGVEIQIEEVRGQ